MSTVVTVSVVIDDTTEIAVQTERGLGPELHLGNDVWVRLGYGANEVAVADSLLAAVTEWHAEIHRRAAERPTPDLYIPDPYHDESYTDYAERRADERAGRSPAYCSHGERWNASDPCTDAERAEAGR